MSRMPALPAVAGLAIALAACGGGEASTAPPTNAPASAATAAPDPPRLVAPPCPEDGGNCERASGQIVYVQRVDPDGDGDAHFALVSDESITAPGLSVIDVAVDLRPDPLPRPGDFLAAAGPVYEGSYGQRQIEAVAIRVARR